MVAGVSGTSSPVLGLDDLKLGYAVTVATAASAASGGTSLTLAAGQGANFAGASAQEPIELSFGTEKLLVTARSTDTLTVTRANYGTTAAVIANAASGYAILEVDMGMAQDLTLDPNIKTLEYTGDGTKVRIPVSEGVSGKINMEFWTQEFMDYIAGVTRVTANLPDDEAARYYPELGDYPYVRIRGKVRVIETATGGAAGHWRLEVPKAIIQRPVLFGSVASGEPTKFEFNFTSVATTTDIGGSTLPGIGGEAVQVLIAELDT